MKGTKKVKICGFTQVEELRSLGDYLPDYVGFIFAPSRRRVDKEQAKRLAAAVPDGVKKVGVFVNETLEIIEDLILECGLDLVQLHGEETQSMVKEISVPVWKAFSVANRSDIEKAWSFQADGILLDAGTKQVRGGTGKSFDWNLLEGLGVTIPSEEKKKDLILAGGLNLDNLERALELPEVDILDVSSGVETQGKKDPDKMGRFLDKVREWNEK